MCVLFIMADMGQPDEGCQYPSPSDTGVDRIWDVGILNGYLLLNLIIGWTTSAPTAKG